MEAIRKGKKLALVRSCEGGIERGRRERERETGPRTKVTADDPGFRALLMRLDGSRSCELHEIPKSGEAANWLGYLLLVTRYGQLRQWTNVWEKEDKGV